MNNFKIKFIRLIRKYTTGPFFMKINCILVSFNQLDSRTQVQIPRDIAFLFLSADTLVIKTTKFYKVTDRSSKKFSLYSSHIFLTYFQKKLPLNTKRSTSKRSKPK